MGKLVKVEVNKRDPWGTARAGSEFSRCRNKPLFTSANMTLVHKGKQEVCVRAQAPGPAAQGPPILKRVAFKILSAKS